MNDKSKQQIVMDMPEEANGIVEERRKRMSIGLYTSCPPSIKAAVDYAINSGYHFIVTQITHPLYTRDLNSTDPCPIGRTDRVMSASDWSRLVVGKISFLDVDSEVESIREYSNKMLYSELGFISHLGNPAVWITLSKPDNIQLARLLNEKLMTSFSYNVWINIPMTHPTRYSPLADIEYDTWEWWNEFRIYCNYDKRLGLVLDMPDVKHLINKDELDRWIGEPVKAITIHTSYFVLNHHGKPVLSKSHQEMIRKFMNLDVQYIIIHDCLGDISLYARYLNFLGKKLYVNDTMMDFVEGFEDYLQNPLQPLTEHLESNIYEVFEKDNVKYDTYYQAILKAVQILSIEYVPVIMVVGAGRGPLVQAVINVSEFLGRKIKIYAVEKNPYAINTLIHRCKHEWNNQVTIVKEDMRVYQPPELADVLVSELLGSFGDNELSPECLDGAQRFLKHTGIVIPQSYTSFIAPIQSTKVHNEIKSNRPADKTLLHCYETPYVSHLANFFNIASPQPLFTFSHPNWNEKISNQRYKKLRFRAEQSCLLTGFVGYFDSCLYRDVQLSILPETHTPNMFSWFPIVFALEVPINVDQGNIIEISFWRLDNQEKVWYEWCLHSPVKTGIVNPNGRSYFIKKH